MSQIYIYGGKMGRPRRIFVPNSIIFVKGKIVQVRKERGSFMAIDEAGELFRRDGDKWILDEGIATKEPLSESDFVPIQVGDASLVPLVDYGVSPDDPKKDKALTFCKNVKTGDIYEYQVFAGRVRRVRVIEYHPPQILSPKDPNTFVGKGAKKARIRGAE